MSEPFKYHWAIAMLLKRAGDSEDIALRQFVVTTENEMQAVGECCEIALEKNKGFGILLISRIKISGDATQ